MCCYLQSLDFSKWVYSFFITFTLFLTGQVIDATINVGPPPPLTNPPTITTLIQSAIDSANDGDTIQLSSGTYVEEIHIINKSLNIIGAGQSNTTIQAPPPDIHLSQNFVYQGITWWCVVMIDNQTASNLQEVNISDLTVDGDSQQDALGPFYGSPNRFFAIGYHNANGTIQRVRTTNTKQTSNFDQITGGGILNASDTTSGPISFTIDHCIVDNYQRIGIDCRGTALMAQVFNNTVNRAFVLPPSPPAPNTATPNGIQFSGSAQGSIINNAVSSNIAAVFFPFPSQGTGIILSGAGANITISGNTTDSNDIGIISINSGDGLNISNNTVTFTETPGPNTIEGIVVEQDIGGLTTISSNMINVPNINMEIVTTSSMNPLFKLMNNRFINSQTGLIVTGSTSSGPQVTMKNDSFTGTSGFYIQEVAAPNNIWPSTATVSFDGLVSGHMTLAEFNQVMAKIYDFHDDPALGVVLEFTPPVAPSVTSISPISGSEFGGTMVTIIGSDFISSNTQVLFGSNPAASFSIISNTEIQAIAPAGIANTTVDVTVSTPFGMSPIVPNDRYTYVPLPPPPPTVTHVTPSSGPSSGQTSVTVTGTDFINGNTTVKFGNSVAADVIVLSPSTLIVTAPPGTGTVDIRVTTPSGTSAIVSEDQYTYISPSPLPPVVTNLDPSSGPNIGGTRVIITGANFIKDETVVYFGTQRSSNVVFSSSSSLIATAPSGIGTVDVTVSTPFGTSPIVPEDQYTYTSTPLPPTVTAIDPSSGPARGKTAVTVTGTNFLGNVQVLFGTTPALSIVVLSSTRLVAISPPGTGIVDITVVTPDGTSSIVPEDQYTYLSSVAPLPPSHFVGIIQKDICRRQYILKANWYPSPSPNVVLYRIYKGKKIIKEIPANAPLHVKIRAHRKQAFKRYTIVAVSSDNLESARVKIKIRKTVFACHGKKHESSRSSTSDR